MVILQRHRNGHDKIARQLHKRGLTCKVIGKDFDLADQSVKVSTLHSAKGLEFEVVFICGLEQFQVDQPVDTHSTEFQQLLDQDRKLLYVGMTRARKLLYITYSGVVPDWIVSRLQQKLAGMRP